MRIPVSTLLLGAILMALPVLAQEDRMLPRPAGAAAPAAVVPAKSKPVVQIAILLDTSGSMQGLIEQAKTQLWKIVNEFAKAQRDGQAPDIQVALYHYGTPSLGAENNYIKMLVPLSNDLDKVSEELFRLTINGGSEYCGAVIQRATQELQWSTDKDAYKAVFIAGNEPFTQGGVDYKSACKEAIAKGIIVNTIFCGDEQAGINTSWKDGAVLADGSYISINHDAQIVHIAAPQDKEIAELGAKINTTYVGYGSAAPAGAENQFRQDANARGAGGGRAGNAVEVERAITKGQAAYSNAAWDLVDAVNQKRVELKDLKAEDLPEEMRNLDEKGREAYIQQKNKEREEIRTQIQKLSAQRDTYIADQRRSQAGQSTLDTAIINTVRSQARTTGLSFPEMPK